MATQEWAWRGGIGKHVTSHRLVYIFYQLYVQHKQEAQLLLRKQSIATSVKTLIPALVS